MADVRKMLSRALQGAGRVELEYEVSNGLQSVDRWFEPDASGRRPEGLLGRMTSGPCGFKVFHPAPTSDQMLACLGKQIAIHQQRLRERRTRPVTEHVPPLWVISSDRPERALRDLGMDPVAEWPSGFYRMVASALPLYAVVLSELPCERDTLMLRLMGEKRVLREALEDLKQLPGDAWEIRAAAGMIDLLRAFAMEAGLVPDPDEEAIKTIAAALYEEMRGE